MKKRSKGNVEVEIKFDGKTPFRTKKEIVSHQSKTIKQLFISCHVIHAEGDADLIIVQTAVKSAEVHQTVVVGEDTDLLVSLCFCAHTTPQTISLGQTLEQE